MPELDPGKDKSFPSLGINTSVGVVLGLGTGIWALTNQRKPIGYFAITGTKLIVAANQSITRLRNRGGEIWMYEKAFIFERFEDFPNHKLADELVSSRGRYGFIASGGFSTLQEALNAVQRLYNGSGLSI